MSYEIEIEETNAQPMVAIRTVAAPEKMGPTMGEIYGKIGAFLGAKGLVPAGPPFARYYGCTDDGFDFEAGMPIAQATDGEGEICAGELPGGKAAATLHTGPYHQLGQAHDACEKWVAENGHEKAGPPWEYYVNDPGEVPENEYQTRVFWPIR